MTLSRAGWAFNAYLAMAGGIITVGIGVFVGVAISDAVLVGSISIVATMIALTVVDLVGSQLRGETVEESDAA